MKVSVSQLLLFHDTGIKIKYESVKLLKDAQGEGVWHLQALSALMQADE